MPNILYRQLEMDEDRSSHVIYSNGRVCMGSSQGGSHVASHLANYSPFASSDILPDGLHLEHSTPSNVMDRPGKLFATKEEIARTPWSKEAMA